MSLQNKLRLKALSNRQRHYFSLALRDAAPTLVATGIWGFVTGIAMLKSGLSEIYAGLMTFFVYAGSAQLTALPLIESGAPLWLISAAAIVVNIRFIIFGAALQPYFRHYSSSRRFFLGYFTTDIAFVLFMSRFSANKEDNQGKDLVGKTQHLWYFLGLIIPNWIVWQFSSFSGIFLGGFIPESWGIEYAAILALMAVVMPLLKTRPFLMCLVVAGAVAWVGQLLPLRLGLVAAVLAGVAAGVVTEQLQHKRST